MLVTYNSILIITALSQNLNATAPKNTGWKLEQRYSICADTVCNCKAISYLLQSYMHLFVLSLQAPTNPIIPFAILTKAIPQ